MSEETVTKTELALQLQGVKTELRTEMRVDLRAEMVAIKEELKRVIYERTEKIETTLLTEFRKYTIASEARLRVVEVMGFGLMERMAALEQRVGELERGRPLP